MNATRHLSAFALPTLALLMACSRASGPTPTGGLVAEPHAPSAAPTEAPSAPAPPPPPPSPLSLVARLPLGHSLPHGHLVATPLPLIQRLPGGGLVVASELGLARADGSGALAVQLVGRGLDHHVFDRLSEGTNNEGLRWVWSSPEKTVLVAELEAMRGGPHLTSYELRGGAFVKTRADAGYVSAVARDGSVLALERVVYEVPDSSIYPKGSGYENNVTELRPARVAVLAGRAKAPTIPAGLCPAAMASARDGALLIAVEECASDAPRVGALRYAPSATEAKVEWLGPREWESDRSDTIAVAASGAGAMYVATGTKLYTWRGEAWATSTPLPGANLTSVSRGDDGALWLVGGDKLFKRATDEGAWTAIALPPAPSDRLDEGQTYIAPHIGDMNFQREGKHDEPADDLRAEARPTKVGAGAMSALTVDAAGEEVLVLASIQREGFLLSTKPRAPVARIPSIALQRTRLAKELPRRSAKSAKDCAFVSFLVFADSATEAAIRPILERIEKAEGAPPGTLAEGVVEGRTRLVVYGESEALVKASKDLAPLGARRICGPAVVERDL